MLATRRRALWAAPAHTTSPHSSLHAKRRMVRQCETLQDFAAIRPCMPLCPPGSLSSAAGATILSCRRAGMWAGLDVQRTAGGESRRVCLLIAALESCCVCSRRSQIMYVAVLEALKLSVCRAESKECCIRTVATETAQPVTLTLCPWSEHQLPWPHFGRRRQRRSEDGIVHALCANERRGGTQVAKYRPRTKQIFGTGPENL